MNFSRYISSSAKNMNLDFRLSKYKVAKWSVDGKTDSTVIGLAFRVKRGRDHAPAGTNPSSTQTR
jgi:hypothetical protein